VLIVCDTFDYEEYPKSVMPGCDPRLESKNLGSMQKLMECYSLSMDIDEQVAQRRAFNWD
jgi:hypothetical protein